MESKFDLGMDIICVKQYQNIEPNTRCHINGCGNLENNSMARGKSGYGYGIRHYVYDSINKKIHEFEYFLTEKEIDEYFITEEEAYQAHMRDQKISQIIN